MKKTTVLLIAMAFCLPLPARACTIPVFRYALEKWELTPYEILVYHHGPLPADVQKLLGHWIKSPNKANIDITIIDLDRKIASNAHNNLSNLGLRTMEDANRPWMLVRYQNYGASAASAWSGPCTTANLCGVLDSPMRQTILGHLTRGVSGVYVLLSSGDEQADKAAYAMAKRELQVLEKKIKLPLQSKEGPQLMLPLPLKVSLPLIVLDRNRPEEAAFVQMLLGMEEGLDKVKGPILFPIFGRGRMLGTLSGKELCEEQILLVTQFLCRECSCQVKDLNPGVDLLLTADWKAIFDKLYEGKEAAPGDKKIDSTEPVSTPIKNEVAPILAPVGPTPSEARPSPVIEAAPEDAFPLPTNDHRSWLWIAAGIAAGLVLISGAMVCRRSGCA